jgi:hypothetical protein
MDQIFVNQIIDAITRGDMTKAIGYGVIFFVLWLEVRGLKKQLQALNETIAKSFAQGEKRFEVIENDVHQIRMDLDQFKKQAPTYGGFKHGEQSV